MHAVAQDGLLGISLRGHGNSVSGRKLRLYRYRYLLHHAL